MKLDLSQTGVITGALREEFDSVVLECRPMFIETMAVVSDKEDGNMDWHVSGPASRNAWASPLFYYCCTLSFIKRLIESGRPVEEIITDSPAHKKILEKWLISQKSNISVLIKNPYKLFAQIYFKRIRYLFGSLFKHVLTFWHGRKAGAGSVDHGKPLTLIDTYVIPGFIKENRYYAGLYEFMDEDLKKQVRFVPTLFGFGARGIKHAFKEIKNCGDMFLLKEHCLKPADYIFAWLHAFRSLGIANYEIMYDGFDVAPLIREEIKGCSGLDSSMTALLNRRFAERLCHSGVPLRMVINWFENQAVDKGWNSGFNQYYPNSIRLGYAGMAPAPNQLNIFPTESDQKAGLLPDEITVIGSGFIPIIREFLPAVKTTAGPAFRFQHLFRPRKSRPENNRFNVLVALPILPDQASDMLTWVANIMPRLQEDPHLLIKPHPAVPIENIPAASTLAKDDRVEFVEGDFIEILEKCHILVGMASSTCLEALARGVPVIVIAGASGLTNNPIPDSIQSGMQHLVYDEQGLYKAIIALKSISPEESKKNEAEGEAVRDRFFTKLTWETRNEFLRIAD